MSDSIVVVKSHESRLNRNTDSLSGSLMCRGLESENSLVHFGIGYSARRTLPYGIWTCVDGRQVVFNREYQPILQRVNGVNSYADPGEWVKDICITEYLFNDACSPIDYLKNKHASFKLSAKDKKECKAALLVCFSVLKEFTPEERPSVNRSYSVKQL